MTEDRYRFGIRLGLAIGAGGLGAELDGMKEKMETVKPRRNEHARMTYTA